MRHTIALLVLVLSTTVAAAEETTAESRWKFGVGVSPALALLKGGGIEVDAMPPGHFRFFASAFTLAIPEAFQRDNADEGWDIRDTGGGVGAEYFLRDDHEGWFVGLIAEMQNHRDERLGMSQSSLEFGLAPEVGYRWMPWRNLYITPRLLAVVPLYTTKEREIAGEKVDEGPVRPVPLLYAGWQF